MLCSVNVALLGHHLSIYFMLQIPPWPGDPNFILGAYGDKTPVMGLLQNTSRVLSELEQVTNVTNSTFQVSKMSLTVRFR